ncbi:MAG: hypothetical protein PHW33_01505 [Candidatus Portnoybacteria bacterium]|nr:hypothetical protein [Candidatus Portnoybacteria bacterium]
MSRINLSQAIFATLAYYDLLNRPLTSTEIFKYLMAGSGSKEFLPVLTQLQKDSRSSNVFNQNEGLYFLAGHSCLVGKREKRAKIAQKKWRLLLRSAKFLALTPFIRLIAVTGSLSADNPETSSDWDLLVVTKKNRLWTARLMLTALTGLLGRRRHGQLTRDRFCLNCYLTDKKLTILPTAKLRDFHAAQEYGRLIPIMETAKGIYEKFTQDNALWLEQFLENYPWPAGPSPKNLKPPRLFNACRRCLEILLSGPPGNWLEKKLSQWQIKRVRAKSQHQPADQVFISDACLMFHPQSKSFRIMKAFEQRLAEFLINH